MQTSTYHIEASLHPIPLIVLPLLFILIMLWKKPDVDIDPKSRVGIFRRIAAFYIDFFTVMIGVMPFITLPSLVVEYFVTGTWQWRFERDYFRYSDLLSLFFFLIGFYAIFYFFKWHFKNGKQTPGQRLFKFKLIQNGDKPSMGIRLLVAWANAAWWPIWPWTIFKWQQDYWWDRASKIIARRTQSGSH